MTDETKVLFVCVHNAARSRMAEALLRELGGARFHVTSAGFEPREVNPLVIEALNDIGLSLPSTAAQTLGLGAVQGGTALPLRHRRLRRGARPEVPAVPRRHAAPVLELPGPRDVYRNPRERLARVIQVREAIRERLEAWVATLPGNQTTAPAGAFPRNSSS